MQNAPIPPDEALRLGNLLSYEILDTSPEKHFDDLAELAAEVCNCSYAMVAFIDKDRKWLKARKGIQATELPRDISFCAHTILQNDVLVVKNTRLDERFHDNPNVAQGYRFAFYAGVPITSAQGFKIGTVSVLDKKAKEEFSHKKQHALSIISRQVSVLLELSTRNKQVLKQSEALLAHEKKLVEQTITGQEEEKSFIADELHENFAQTLAATKLYLDFAEQSRELSAVFIKKSKANILQIIKEIKALSRSMLPGTFRDTNYLDFIQDMLQEYGKQHDMDIRFSHKGDLASYNSNIGLTLFRVIQYQLKTAQYSKATKVFIALETADKIGLTFIHDGKIADALEPERKLLLHHIKTRIGLLKGTVRTGTDKKGYNLLEIDIPLADQV